MMTGLKDDVFLQRSGRFLTLWCSAMVLHLGGSSTEKVAIGYSFRTDKGRVLLIKSREKN